MAQPLVESYSFGAIVIDGREYRRDLIVTPTKIVSNWWRAEGHRLQMSDVESVLGEEVDAVVVGTGYSGYVKVDREVVEEFERRGVEVHVLDSRRAVSKYNELVKRGKRVMLLIHLTC